MKPKVTGIGGVFFKTSDPKATKDWYQKHLGIECDQYGHMFTWRDDKNPPKRCSTQWSPMKDNTDYYAPSESEFMINYRVQNLDALLEDLKKKGVEIIGSPETYEYGKFAWIMDNDGHKIELWEPIDEAFFR